MIINRLNKNFYKELDKILNNGKRLETKCNMDYLIDIYELNNQKYQVTSNLEYGIFSKIETIE
jgi:hypothetical protein